MTHRLRQCVITHFLVAWESHGGIDSDNGIWLASSNFMAPQHGFLQKTYVILLTNELVYHLRVNHFWTHCLRRCVMHHFVTHCLRRCVMNHFVTHCMRRYFVLHVCAIVLYIIL